MEKTMRGLRFVALAIAAFTLTACENMPSSTRLGPRTITLSGKTYSETELGNFVSWRCRELIRGESTLVEVGFVLYDGGVSGVLARYQRQGLNQRWDWGPGGGKFSIIIKPDGTGLYYDFSSVPSGETTKANDIYKCSQ
jgi:hypothetical protein